MDDTLGGNLIKAIRAFLHGEPVELANLSSEELRAYQQTILLVDEKGTIRLPKQANWWTGSPEE